MQEQDGADFIPLPLSAYAGQRHQGSLPDAWETLSAAGVISKPSTLAPHAQAVAPQEDAAAAALEALIATSTGEDPFEAFAGATVTGASSWAALEEEGEEDILPEQDGEGDEEALFEEDEDLVSPAAAERSLTEKRAGGIPRPTSGGVAAKGRGAPPGPPTFSLAQDAEEEGSTAVSFHSLEKASAVKRMLETETPGEKKSFMGSLIALIVVALLGGMGYFGFSFYEGSTPEGQAQAAAQERYDAGEVLLATVPCEGEWETSDDGVTKRLQCPAPQEGVYRYALISRGLLAGSTWTKTAQAWERDAYVVTDQKYWGVLSTQRDDLTSLAQAEGLPICDLVAGENLYCPVS